MKIVVEKNRRGKWYWKIIASNGKILAHSEEYSRKQACIDTVFLVVAAKIEFKA